MCNDYDMDILLDYIWDELQKQDDKTGFRLGILYLRLTG